MFGVLCRIIAFGCLQDFAQHLRNTTEDGLSGVFLIGDSYSAKTIISDMGLT